MAEKVLINIDLKEEKDVYFGISNTILSYNQKKEFTADDIVEELRSLNWDEEVFKKWNIRKMIEISLENLVNHGKVEDNPRTYFLR